MKDYDEARFKREVVEKLGARRAEALVPYAASRLHGMLSKPGRWHEFGAAFPHIEDQFYSPSRLDPKKKTHTRFRDKYCSKEAIRQLLLQTTSGYSLRGLTRLKIDGERKGNFAVKIGRQFGHPIGDDNGQVCLVIFFDENATLITAYPLTLEAANEA